MRLKASNSALSAILVLLLLFAASSGVLAAPKILYAEIRFQSAEKAYAYVRVQGNRLWVASTLDGLKKAKPITAQPEADGYSSKTQNSYRYIFPETILPVSVKGLSEVSAVFYTVVHTSVGREAHSKDMPHTQALMSVEFHLTKTDRAGNRWTYLFRPSAFKAAEKSIVKFPAFELPQIDNLQLTIETKIEDKKAHIALQAKIGDMNIENVLKNGKNAACEVKIINANGKVIVNEKGDLSKFGFT